MAIRQTYPVQAEVGADGTAEAQLTARGDVIVVHTRVSVSSDTNQPTAHLDLNGSEFEGTYAGANDQSNTVHLMLAGDRLTCRWVGADVGATATLYVRGIEYPAGQGMAAYARMIAGR